MGTLGRTVAVGLVGCLGLQAAAEFAPASRIYGLAKAGDALRVGPDDDETVLKALLQAATASRAGGPG